MNISQTQSESNFFPFLFELIGDYEKSMAFSVQVLKIGDKCFYIARGSTNAEKLLILGSTFFSL